MATLSISTTDSGNTGGRTGQLYSNKALLLLFMPLVIEQTLHITVGFADSLIISEVGEAAVSGVSLVNFLMSFLNYLLLAVSVGGSVVISQHLGHKNVKEARHAANQLVWTVSLLSLIMASVIFFYQELEQPSLS